MNSCIYCNGPTKQKVCMARSCRNSYNKQHNHDNIEHYREIKRKEHSRNYANRKSKHQTKSRERYYNNFINTIIIYSKSRAKQYSLDFNLDKEFISTLYEIQNKKCALTGLDFKFEQQTGYKKRRPFAPSIDRIDCTKGYTQDNVRLVCSVVNIALSDFGDQVFDQMCEAYVNKKRECNAKQE